ncbi:MAG: hypothetical protein ABR913_01430 [Sedimentisphaerales bacterium]|jgi:parallel beta-helix repeat protein
MRYKLILILVLVFCSIVYASNNIDVNSAGGGNYTTISDALSGCSDGDVIRVWYGTNGVYEEGLAISNATTDTKTITIQKYPGEGAISIRPTGTTYPLRSLNEDEGGTITISDMNFDCSSSSASYNVYAQGKQNFVLTNCLFTGIQYCGLYATSGTNTINRSITINGGTMKTPAYGAYPVMCKDGNLTLNGMTLDSSANGSYALFYESASSDAGNVTLSGDTITSADIAVYLEAIGTLPSANISGCTISTPKQGIYTTNTITDFNASYNTITTSLTGIYLIRAVLTNSNINNNIITTGGDVSGATGIDWESGTGTTCHICNNMISGGREGIEMSGTYGFTNAVINNNTVSIATATQGVGILLGCNEHYYDTSGDGALSQTDANATQQADVSYNSVTLSGGETAKSHAMGVMQGWNNVRIYGNRIIGGNDSLVIKGRYYDISYNTISGSSLACIYLCGAQSCKVKNNTCVALGKGAALEISSNKSDTSPINPLYNTITNNIFDANLSHYSFEIDDTSKHYSTYMNYNCIRGGVNKLAFLNGSVITTLALLQSQWATGTFDTANFWLLNDANSINADPQFKDATNGDYSLQSYSPCINSGMPMGGGNTTMGAWQPKASGFDSNDDGKIDFFDFAAFAQHWLEGVTQ